MPIKTRQGYTIWYIKVLLLRKKTYGFHISKAALQKHLGSLNVKVVSEKTEQTDVFGHSLYSRNKKEEKILHHLKGSLKKKVLLFCC